MNHNTLIPLFMEIYCVICISNYSSRQKTSETPSTYLEDSKS